MAQAQDEGWKVSEVAELVGLPRRDIQRACYEGRGGAAILSPQDSSWGRRTYSTQDLARLFLTSELRGEGRSLPEVKAEFDAQQAAGRDVPAMLECAERRLAELVEHASGRLLRAQALKCALDEEGKAALAGLVAGRAAQRAAQTNPDVCARFARRFCACMEELGTLARAGEPCGGEGAAAAAALCADLLREDGMAPDELRGLVDDLLGEPGFDLAAELWLGPGSLRFAREAWDTWYSCLSR